MKTAVVVAGGPKEEIVLDDFLFPRHECFFIGADHGAITLLEAGITPRAAVGDFDSLTKEEWLTIQSKVDSIEGFQAEKNETDTELAILKALEERPERIFITGVTGGRLDHYESNLHTVYRLQSLNKNIPMIIINKTNQLQFLFNGLNKLTRNSFYTYVSFHPFGGDVSEVTLRGVKYETTKLDMPVGSGRFTSNEITENEATIEFSAGVVLMTQSKD